MVITKIIQNKRLKNRFSVFVDGKFSFSVPVDLLSELGIAKGDTLDESDLENILEKNLRSALYNRCLSFLSFRPRTQKEVTDYIKKYSKKKGYDDSVVGKIIPDLLSKLKSLGLLDDLEFGRWFVDKRFTSKNLYGRRLVKSQLLEKGLSAEMADKVLSESKNVFGEKSLGTLKKRYKSYALKDPDKAKERILSYLVRRGFSYSEAYKAFDSLISSS